MKLMTSIILAVFLMTAGMHAGNKKPSWVKKRPVNNLFYIGISSVSKGPENDFRNIAQQQALNDLASQIQISITSTNIRQIIEKDNDLSDSYQSFLQSAIQADLEGYELIDTWEDKNEYWVYYRLSKEKYQAIKRAKINKAIKLALDFYEKALSYETDHLMAEAIRFYFQAIGAVERYATESLETQFRGKKIYVLNELITALQGTISAISLQSDTKTIEVKRGLTSYPPVSVSARYNVQECPDCIIPRLPVFIQPNEMIEFLSSRIETNNTGKAVINLHKIDARVKEQMITTRIDILKLCNTEDPTPLVQSIINNLPVIQDQTKVVLKGLSAYISGQEKNLGQPVEVEHIVPAIKNALSESGFTFTDSPDGSDWLIEVKANTTKGTKVYSLFTAFADIDISIKELSGNREVFRQALHHIKGIQLDFEAAGLKALENGALKSVNEYIPEILKLIEE